MRRKERKYCGSDLDQICPWIYFFQIMQSIHRRFLSVPNKKTTTKNMKHEKNDIGQTWSE